MDTDDRNHATPRTPDFELTSADLREVASFALAAAEEVLPLFEDDRPGDERPRQAIETAREFVLGAPRSRAQRIAAPAAHRAAKEASTQVAFHAAMAAGDAAASAYLHPLADAVQVGHILRPAAHAARARELLGIDNPHAGADSLATAGRRVTPTLVQVLCRYPVSSDGTNRVTQLMHQLDLALRGGAPTGREGGSE